ncbi:ABC transporter permease [Ruminococcus sp.]|uniref:ABC transporter permease n=1 Tax=Ruminococcus sp. TaxID=41978 RepID=UPI0026208020|nr:ABC transporter permease [Ruminococcus sp.]MDD6990111.1 ABC transporter permease [Ruminococcus sp.]MDY6202796.1 ABC transporter permease [Ruminococcus sp.]
MNTLNKLTLKNLKLNKSRTIVTIIGILLSTALITVVAGIAASGQQTMINAEINFSGDYDLSLSGNITDKDVKEISANRNVESVYIEDNSGVAQMPTYKNETRPYAYIQALSAKAFTDCFNLPLESGRYPQNSSELLLTQTFVLNSAQKYEIGDTITLELGERKTADGESIIDVSNYNKTYKINENGEAETIDCEEHFETQSTKTFKIVGILDEYYSNSISMSDYNCISPVFTVADANKISDEASLYVKFTDEGERNYIQTSSQITGLSEEHLREYLNQSYELEKGEIKYDFFRVQTSLLSYKGYALSDNSLQMFFTLAAIIIAIVIVASVFVIRNSFAISITEKTKLYGMLSSVGATSRQIRHNVLFEGFVLALIGIPLGILLGVGVVAVLIQLLNVLLVDMLNGTSFVYSVPVFAIVLAVALSLLTILFSTLGSALRASRIAPIDAVRGNNDIKIKKKQKAYKCPKFIKKLFGTGGEIAYKNLKRSRKKYRTTVISIVVSVAVFIAVSSFIQYGTEYSSKYYHEIDYNLSVNRYDFYKEFDEINSDFETLSQLDGVKNCRLEMNAVGYLKSSDKLDSVLSSDAKYYSGDYGEDEGDLYDIAIFSFDDKTYKQKLKDLGLDYDKVKDKGVLLNNFEYKDQDKKTKKGELFKADKVNSLTLSESGDPSNDEYNKTFDIEIAKVYNSTPETLKYLLPSEYSVYLIVSEDTLKNNYDMSYIGYSFFIDAKNADELEETITELDGGQTFEVYNVEKMANMYNVMTLVISIFAYGFIIVISLIGVTNIFNTITTNMHLRSKEFAMLKSIGMTKREFNRMIRLESLFYGVKSLIIGIPLGLLSGLGIFKAFSMNLATDFVVPYTAILISIVFVFAVVWLIMRFSISKVQKQNIIETIRNDNI